MNRLRALALAVAFTASAAAQAVEFSTLEERMSRAEFTAAGLQNLSPEQLKALNDWLRINGLAPGAPVARGKSGPNDVPEFYPEEEDRQVIESSIAGNLDGWLGKSSFKLENGQVWQQADSSRMTGLGLSSPSVRIRPTLLGNWLMYIDGCGCKPLPVRRIK